jgi:hypothetical protein
LFGLACLVYGGADVAVTIANRPERVNLRTGAMWRIGQENG